MWVCLGGILDISGHSVWDNRGPFLIVDPRGVFLGRVNIEIAGIFRGWGPLYIVPPVVWRWGAGCVFFGLGGGEYLGRDMYRLGEGAKYILHLGRLEYISLGLVG